jgi:SAM-dependent methyltransferase
MQIQPHNEKAANTWSSPGVLYDTISRGIADAIEHAIDRLDVRAGERVLDLACGTGWASRAIATRTAANVAGVDIAHGLVEAARESARRANLSIDYRVGDAEALPYEDAQFDALISTFGVMFASKPEAAAREIARVTKPGGRVALTTWKPDSTVFEMFTVMKPFMAQPPTPPPPSPFAWGSRDRVRELLGDAFTLGFEEGVSPFRASSPREGYEIWRTMYGPTRMLAASLPDDRRAAFEGAMLAFLGRFVTDLGVSKPREYLLTIATRKTP